uniref:PNPLA domain-containing protein n=1 Tax=Panagrolaimus sp. PS1159 TaxID=55785 RepID=A0AC35F1Z0_9BILA
MESVKILVDKLDENGFRRMLNSGFRPLHKPIQNTFKKEVADIIIGKNCKFLEIKNELNETPIFSCIRNGDLAMVLHLIALGANVEEKDSEGRNVLESAFTHEKIVFVKLFHSLGFEIDKEVLKSKCKVPSSMWSELDRILKELQTKNNPVIVSPIMEQMQNILIEEVLKPDSPKGVRVLSLDGGGIRGIMSVIILKELESRLQQKLQNPNVLVAQFFNIIGGTSTGAIIALALAKGKSAFDILKLYIRFRDKVFAGKRPYDSSRLEEFLKQELGETTTLENISKFNGLKLMITTTKADIMPPQLVLLRNYDIYCETSTKSALAWFAARCSSAAPTFFDSPKQTYLDGGLMANNPCSDILVELTKFDITRQLNNQPPLPLACVLSIGTGRPPPKSTNAATVSVPQGFGDILRNGFNQITGFMSLTKMFIDQICASDGAVVDRARAMAFTKHSPFFRLSPELPTEVELDDKDDMIILDLMFAARCYLHQEEKSFEQLVTILATYAN